MRQVPIPIACLTSLVIMLLSGELRNAELLKVCSLVVRLLRTRRTLGLWTKLDPVILLRFLTKTLPGSAVSAPALVSILVGAQNELMRPPFRGAPTLAPLLAEVLITVSSEAG